jgi:hypothetical protein
VCEDELVRSTLVAAAATLAIAGWLAPAAAAEPASCDDPYCVPGIAAGVELGAPCANATTYVFGTTSRGRLVFCGSPRRYEPRYFRSPPMMGVKNENTSCDGYSNAVAQAPDGLFLSCGVRDGQATWIRGDT